MAHEADEAQEAPHQTASPTPADAQLGGSFDTGWPAKSLWSAQPRPRPTSQAIPSPSPAVNERELFGGAAPGKQTHGPLSSDRESKLDASVGSGGDGPLRGQRPSPRIFPDPNETSKGYSEKEIILKYGPLIRGGHDKTPRHEKTPEELWIERMIRRDLRSIEYLKPRAERSTSMRGHYRTAARDAWQRLQENFQWLHAARGHRMTLRPGHDIDAAVASLDVRKHGWDAVPRPSRKRQRRLSSPGEEDKDIIDDNDNGNNDNGNNDNGEADRTGRRRRAAKAQLKQDIRRLKKSLGMVSPDEGENDVAAAAADGNAKTKKEELIAEAVIGSPPTSPRRGFPRGRARYIVEYARDKKKPLWWDSKTDTFLYAGAFPFPLPDLWGKDAAASPGEGGEAEDGEQQKKS
ncbi:hypothetical protein MAPG_08987 [Magnaporthiopsis poae ATCC 64411]|uniref:Uncharacterized protein n=1 Tax=Magnaporthiopsis poae (strain ATCC 64411 / 73-15) TaxID=644358 RepID=A0A0C4E8R9_MAGP6|nr:hypothetical protein MAPG_08987 [Magnaporthiopsis poae ATCC 64411]